MNMRLLKALIFYSLCFLFALGCNPQDEDSSPIDPDENSPQAPVPSAPSQPDTGNETQSLFAFQEHTAQAGLNFQHSTSRQMERDHIVSGVASGDYDNDGDIDLYVVAGDGGGENALFQNDGQGNFTNVAESAGVNILGENGTGPKFVDYDGDSHLDLFIGGVDPDFQDPLNYAGVQPRLFRNLGDGTFEETTQNSGLDQANSALDSAFADFDQDGDLDLVVSHWGTLLNYERYRENQGDGTFVAATEGSGLKEQFGLGELPIEISFTPNTADINNDGWMDILMVADFGKSKVYLNNQDGTFNNITDDVITDENGMGGAVGDYDNDGDIDWFVSSIFDEDGEVARGLNHGITGNRLYRNKGDGSFEDATEEAGVRHGYWGWGASFADFNNDIHLDLIHVNGWVQDEYLTDPTRIYLSNGDGTFAEKAIDLGVDDEGQGRGIVIFDADNDGDLDIFIANNNGGSKYYKNVGEKGNYLSLKLQGRAPNTQAIGARIEIELEDQTLTREIRIGTNFVSQNPALAHFGLGDAEVVERIRVRWPDGQIQIWDNINVNQSLTFQQDIP